MSGLWRRVSRRSVVPIVQAEATLAATPTTLPRRRPALCAGHPPVSTTPQARNEDLGLLDDMLAAAAHDPLLVAVGEIGLDFFVPEPGCRAPVVF